MTTPETTPTPAPEWHELDDAAREPYRQRARYALYDLHACGREWCAWSVGTMTEEDFTVAADTEWHVNLVAHTMYDIVRETAARLAAAVAEIERLRAELVEAEQRAAGPFFVCCEAIEDITSYGLRLEEALEDVLAPLGEHLEDMYAPDEWAAAVARWEVTVGHGAIMEPYINDDGEPALMLKSAAGWWHYALRLTVTPDGCPVLTAERRDGGAR